jgi:AraC-like DNA-binding protein
VQVIHVAPSSPVLRPFIEAIWYYAGELPHARERIVPAGNMQLLVNLHEDELRTYEDADFARVCRMRGAAVSGPYARPFGIDTAEQRRIVGVSFKPGGAAPFFAVPSQQLRDQHVELEALWGRDGAQLRERLLEAPSPAAALQRLEALLLERAAHRLELDKLVDFAIGALERGVPVQRLTAALGITPNRFIRHFRDAVGLTPKRFARVRRFGRVLESIEQGRPIAWSALAADCGYFDQAHLIHEFREFSGINPTHYRPTGGRNHALIDT